MDLHIAIRSGCFWPGIGLVLAKVMKSAKEIRPDDKKRGAAPAVGRAAACLSGVAGDARREGRRRGDGLPGMAVAGNGPAAIRRYLISH